MKIILKNLDETRAWGREFARTLQMPVVVALHGDLGMGKSEVARSIIQELCGSDTVVPSPTFTLVQSYDALGYRISHFDLYRISDPSELTEIGLEHACANDIVLIEWPEIASHILPLDTIHIYITEENGERAIKINRV
ncbi:MAG: tRNA (adenosine(37)-N6)-threonylcarbamoyltransferase complex ATPase subunit type 1 TsaE [Alphaproteobacteria bacterium]|nr:tRNA (adenosine(37)-N6)-threonylcarbamoyltransferase complex ATPase subunit type 1 TsaE [Alphaproteobacteria bacterium]